MRFNEVERQADEDEYGKWDIDDTRRPRLTLKHLNKMRKMRSMAEADHIKQAEQWRDMYARSSGE